MKYGKSWKSKSYVRTIDDDQAQRRERHAVELPAGAAPRRLNICNAKAYTLNSS
jgi:hypothetical protein